MAQQAVQSSGVEVEFRDWLRVLRRRKRLIFAIVVVVVGLGLTYSWLQEPVYAAQAEVLLQPKSSETIFDANTGLPNDPARNVQTEIQVVKSRPVRDAVRKKLGDTGSVSVIPQGQTDVILVQAESTDPKRAAAVADAYANTYIDLRRSEAVDEALATAKQIQQKVDDLQKAIDGAANVSQKESILRTQEVFKQKLDELQVGASITSGGAHLVSAASVPTSPVRPRPVQTGVLALGVGLVLGIGLTFVTEYLDDSVKTKEDLERAVPGLPAMGLIPAVSGWKTNDSPHLTTLDEPNSPVAEAYRTLRTAVQFLALDPPLKTFQVTSASAQEGKTTTLANLAVTIAQAGHKVLIVCCDLRRPRIHEFFGLSNQVGLTSVLLGEAPLSAAIQDAPDIEGLSVLASGPRPPNPSELLASRRLGKLFTAVRGYAQVVLIDSPPVLPVTDALVLCRRVDAVIVVSMAGSTTRRNATRAVELLAQVDAPVIGTVLNRAKPEGRYGYTDTYYSREPARPSRRSRPQTEGAVDPSTNGQPLPVRPRREEPRPDARRPEAARD